MELEVLREALLLIRTQIFGHVTFLYNLPKITKKNRCHELPKYSNLNSDCVDIEVAFLKICEPSYVFSIQLTNGGRL